MQRWCWSRRDTPVQTGGRLRGKRGYDGGGGGVTGVGNGYDGDGGGVTGVGSAYDADESGVAEMKSGYDGGGGAGMTGMGGEDGGRQEREWGLALCGGGLVEHCPDGGEVEGEALQDRVAAELGGALQALRSLVGAVDPD